jgi:hypothetical protein
MLIPNYNIEKDDFTVILSSHFFGVIEFIDKNGIDNLEFWG